MARSAGNGSRIRSGRVRPFVAAIALVAAAVAGFVPPAPAAAHNVDPPYLDGGDSVCSGWKLRFLNLGFTSVDFDVAEEGWAWVNRAQKMKSAVGIATKSKIAHNDTPANHFSHDWNVDLRLDPGQEYLLSDVNGRDLASDVPQKIEMEWETGITPGQTSGATDRPWFPAWATPSVGDRVWTEGHWIFDCGHGVSVKTAMPVAGDPTSCPAGTEAGFRVLGSNQIEYTDCRDDHFRSEIHPGRAIASMRSQTATLPGSGTTPVPVTATDLYIHGRGGFIVQQLNCGIGIILDDESCPTTTTPIDDTYSFDICLPPKPSPLAALDWSVSPGPGNTLNQVPVIDDVEAVGGCDAAPDEYGNDFDDGTMLRAVVDLRGSGATPQDVYARHITAGWVFPTAAPMRHLQLRLDQMDLHNDHEASGFNGEFSFLWMNVNRSTQDEWYRLVNFDIPTDDGSATGCGDRNNTLEDYDDDRLCGTGLLNFAGPNYDFYPRPGQQFTVSTRGFEQDCYDRNFGSGEFRLLEYVACHGGNPTQIVNWGNNDKLADIEATFGSDVAPGRYEPSATGEVTIGNDTFIVRQFELEFVISEIPLTNEDVADLGVEKSCTYAGEVALVGNPVTCTVTVTNNGPGLPRAVTVADTLTTALAPAQYTMGTPVASVGAHAAAAPCTVTPPNAFSCAVGTIPVGETATVTVPVTPRAPGSFVNTASVSTASTDPVSSNNSAQDSVVVYLPVSVDVQPGDAINAINTGRNGVVPVAVLTTPTFDATTIDVRTVCFGDVGAPSERSCTEVHGTGHLVDVDRDRDLDLLLHYSFARTGIDVGDTQACLIGMTRSGIGVFGCDFIRAL